MGTIDSDGRESIPKRCPIIYKDEAVPTDIQVSSTLSVSSSKKPLSTPYAGSTVGGIGRLISQMSWGAPWCSLTTRSTPFGEARLVGTLGTIVELVAAAFTLFDHKVSHVCLFHNARVIENIPQA
jgi:hypothetical protein